MNDLDSRKYCLDNAISGEMIQWKTENEFNSIVNFIRTYANWKYGDDWGGVSGASSLTFHTNMYYDKDDVSNHDSTHLRYIKK